MSEPATRQEAAVPWNDFVKFVRQLSHDLRNQLNAAELQAVLLNELTADPELKGEVRRLRELVSQLGTTLQRLSSSLAEPRPLPMPYPAAEFVADVQKKIAQTFAKEAPLVKWHTALDGAMLHIDPTLIEAAVLELFDNAFRHGRGAGEMEARAEAGGGRFVLSLREAKSAQIDGSLLSQPLGNVSHGHYGLGRRMVREILREHGGTLETTMQPDAMINRIVLPCSESPG